MYLGLVIFSHVSLLTVDLPVMMNIKICADVHWAVLLCCMAASGWDPAEIGDLLEDRFYNKIFKVQTCHLHCSLAVVIIHWFLVQYFTFYIIFYKWFMFC